MVVKESLNSFVRNQNPIKSLELGYEIIIREFFKQHNIPDKYYEVTEDNTIIFNTDLNLMFNRNITELPNNLTINGYLTIMGTHIIKLPNNLIISSWLDLRNTNIIELPNDLIVMDKILLYKEQKKLKNFIENSKFKDKIKIYD
jgi:hypothetical protein